MGDHWGSLYHAGNTPGCYRGDQCGRILRDLVGVGHGLNRLDGLVVSAARYSELVEHLRWNVERDDIKPSPPTPLPHGEGQNGKRLCSDISTFHLCEKVNMTDKQISKPDGQPLTEATFFIL